MGAPGVCISTISLTGSLTGLDSRLYSTLDALEAGVDAACRAGRVPRVFTSWQAGDDVATFVQFSTAP